MREFHDHADDFIVADPFVLFAAITDIDRLPEWNSAIERVIECPDQLTVGACWTVELHPSPGLRWRSVSTLEELDVSGLRFGYRTVNADGNPSYALWNWELFPQSGGTTVSVRWDVHLETLDRRLLGGPIRKRQLRNEVAASLSALGAHVISSVR
jgi:hypothetical protein